MLLDYLNIIIYIFLCLLISCLIFFISFLLVPISYSNEKVSSYECGFEPFADTRKKADIRYYIVALLFILFDLEIAYLYPWGMDSTFFSFECFFSILFFLFLLTVGFIYEWKQGALDWE